MKSFQETYKNIKESVLNEVSKKDMAKDYMKRAEAEKKAGGEVDIDYKLPTVSVTLSDGSEYFFQEEEAEDLIDEHEDDADDLNIPLEDFILAQAQNW